MQKRVIVQSASLPDGLVIKVEENLPLGQLKHAVLTALPAERVSAGMEIFDEADDDVDTRAFADDEKLLPGRIYHAGYCKAVEVVVRYAGRTAQRRFPPVTRISRIKRWALHELGITVEDGNELLLQVSGSTVQPARDQHVGNFVEQGVCQAVFDLVRSYTINGDAGVSADEALLRQHLERAPFLLGAMNGRWALRTVKWPFVFVDVVARDKRSYTLRLQCDGYPSLPTGGFWDCDGGAWLPAKRWPRAGARFGSALRADWQNGTALYIPCDRNSIHGHEQWLQLHPAWVWEPRIGLARYLEVVWTMLNGDDYAAPTA